MNETKTVAIGEANYQINRMTAKTGSWLLMLLMGKMVKIMQETAQPTSETNPATDQSKDSEAAASAAIQFMLMNLEEDVFNRVQQHALSVCFRLEPSGNVTIPMPIVTSDGRFAIKELESDIASVLQLTSQALFFNLAPFFTAGKLTGLLQTQ